MSVSGISSSSLVDYNTQSVQNRMQQFQQAFQQLGKDLQSGNLTAAQTDLAAMQQSRPHTNSASSLQHHNLIAQDFKQLATDLQSGNISAAQKDYATVQQDFQNGAAHGQHPHQGGGGSGTSAIGRLLAPLGHAVQSGAVLGSHLLGPFGPVLRSSKLLATQQPYSTVQQAVQQFAQINALPMQESSQSSSDGISVNA